VSWSFVLKQAKENVFMEESFQNQPENPPGTSPTRGEEAFGYFGEKEGLQTTGWRSTGKVRNSEIAAKASAQQESRWVLPSHDQLQNIRRREYLAGPWLEDLAKLFSLPFQEHHEVEKDDDHTPDQIRLMQTQDLKYITMKRTIEANKIKRLQAELHMTDVANRIPNKHTFFVDNDEDAANFDVATRLDTHPALLGRRTNRPRLGDINKLAKKLGDETDVVAMQRIREQKYKELLKRIDRERELKVIMEKMELKRKLQEKRSLEPKRVKKGTKSSAPIYEFKFERKK
jgi:Utp11 protein